MHSLTRSVGQARTGTGKTGAYAIPVLQTILANKKAAGAKPHVAAIVLVVRLLRSLLSLSVTLSISLCVSFTCLYLVRSFSFLQLTRFLRSGSRPRS